MFVETTLPPSDAIRLLDQLPSAIDLVEYAVGDGTEPFVHLVLDGLAVSPQFVREYRMTETGKPYLKPGYAAITDIYNDPVTGIEFIQVAGMFDENPNYYQAEEMLRDCTFEDDQVRGCPQGHNHLMLLGPTRDRSLVAHQGTRRTTLISRECEKKSLFAPGVILFAPGVILRSISTWGTEGSRHGFAGLTTKAVEAELEDPEPMVVWPEIHESPEQVIGFSRAWRNGTFVTCGIPKLRNSSVALSPLRLVVYRAYRVDVRDDTPFVEPVPGFELIGTSLNQCGMFLGTTTAASDTDEPRAICRLDANGGSIPGVEFRQYRDLPEDLGRMVQGLDDLCARELAA